MAIFQDGVNMFSVTIPVPTVFIYIAIVLVVVLIAKFIIRFVGMG